MEKDELQEKSETFLALKEQIDALEQIAASVREEITSIVEARRAGDTNQSRWDFDHSSVLWVNPSERSSLDRAKLVQAGVTVEQLEKGTVKKTTSGYVKVEHKK